MAGNFLFIIDLVLASVGSRDKLKAKTAFYKIS